MVSERHKAYEKVDQPADQHSKETSAYNLKIKLQSSAKPKFDKKTGCLDMKELPKLSKAALEDMVEDLESGNIIPIEAIYWKGDNIAPIDINYKNYIGLKRVKKPGVREVTVYNPENKMIEIIDFSVHKEVVQQDEDK